MIAVTKNKPWILGISAGFHNGSACLLRGDELVVAIQEERLTRQKRSRILAGRRCLAIPYCLQTAGIAPGDLDLVVSCPILLPWELEEQDVGLNPILRVHANGIPTLTIPHHLGHAVGAFATSGFEESAVLVVDGSGSFLPFLPADERRVVKKLVEDGGEHISLYRFSAGSVTPLEKHLGNFRYVLDLRRGGMPPFSSLGHMFSSAALQIFDNYLEAGKVMGLAPYGRPEIPLQDFFEIKDGTFVFSTLVPERFRHDDRWPERREEYENLAASVQAALEHALLYLVDELHRKCDSGNLCYAGGVALNSIANERIVRESAYREVFIMPAAEDSGPAIGAAYYGLWHLTGSFRGRKQMADATGRRYAQGAVDTAIARTPAVEVVQCTDVLDETARLLLDGKIIGWFQGGSEFGPRALGQRSILCDPRRPDGKEVLNARVKHREAFRPFAPAILAEEAERWFNLNGCHCSAGDFMLRVAEFADVRKGQVPAVVHVDGTGRLQTVTEQANPRFYQLIRKFFAATGVPILLNTSFNVMGEPIVETPDDALWCLLYTDLDGCVLEDRLVVRKQGYRSLLDLYPRLTTSRYSIHLPILESRLITDLSQMETASFALTVQERHVEERHATPPEFKILCHIDGKTDGWGLLGTLRSLGNGMDERALARRLEVLRRFAIIELSAEPELRAPEISQEDVACN
jgi:carbamoyltransferase